MKTFRANGMLRAPAISSLFGIVLAAGCATPPVVEKLPPETAARPDIPKAPRKDETPPNPIQQVSAETAPPPPDASPVEPGISGPHDAPYYVNLALDRNRRVLAARRDVAAVFETIPQVTSLEDPLLTNSFWPFAGHNPQTASGRMPYSLRVSQDVPWPEKLGVRGEVAQQEARMAMTRLAAEELAVAEQVRIAYYDLYFYQRVVAITRENQSILEDLVQFAEIRQRTGGSVQDVLRVQIEQDRLRRQLIEYESRLEQTQADLAALLHSSGAAQPRASQELELPPVPETLEHLYEIAARCRPELRERLHAIIRDQRERDLARLDYYPDMNVGLDWQAIEQSDSLSPAANGQDNVGFSVGVTLPVYRDRLRAGLREAEHRVVESSRRYDSEKDETYRRIRRLVAAADAAHRQASLYRDDIVPRTEQALEVSIGDYRAGKTDILQVINNYTELLTFQIQIAGFERDLGQSLASLERVVGREVAPSLTAPEPERDVPPPPTAAPDDAENVGSRNDKRARPPSPPAVGTSN